MKFTLGIDRDQRKNTPMLSGCINYFLAAIAGVARHSKRSNAQHNPGEPMHWARGKSTDHAECIVRHLSDMQDIEAFMRRNQPAGRAYLPGDEIVQTLLQEADALAWRALALSQELYEKYGDAPPSPASVLPKPERCEFSVDKGAYMCELEKGHAGPCGSSQPPVLIPDAPVDSVIAEITGGAARPSKELDPVSRNGDGKWYFWDDGWMLQSGPYDSEQETRAAYGEYRRVQDAENA